MSKGILTKREKEVFSLLIENKTTREIANILSISEKTVRNHISNTMQKLSVKGRAQAIWVTNLDHSKRHEDLDLYKTYTPEEYPKYDNYDAINVDKTKDIPADYAGAMGVPITFLDKYNPEQFEILGLSQKVGMGLESKKFYNDYWEMRKDGTKTGSSGQKTNGNPVMKGRSPSNNYFTNGVETVYSLYARIFIKNKKLKN